MRRESAENPVYQKLPLKKAPIVDPPAAATLLAAVIGYGLDRASTMLKIGQKHPKGAAKM
jgi:hypothetical protein